jgi:transcriptional regulator with XRE-family HTH domain
MVHMTVTAARSNKQERRSELGEFLKARRAQVRPADVGLPGGDRRRTPGLRREEVALLAGVGITWYTWLEQGRPINASAQVLDSVARTLQLGRPEREHLYRLAAATPLRPERTADPDEDLLREIVDAIDPTPAVLANERFDVLAVNRGFHDLFRDWHTLPCVHRNLLWCIVTEPRARTALLNYETEVPYLVARLRAGYGAHVGDPEWEEDLARLIRVCPEFEELWSRHEVAEPQTRIRRILHPEVGEVAVRVTELAVAAHPDLRLFVETPVDEVSRERLARTRTTS